MLRFRLLTWKRKNGMYIVATYLDRESADRSARELAFRNKEKSFYLFDEQKPGEVTVYSVNLLDYSLSVYTQPSGDARAVAERGEKV